MISNPELDHSSEDMATLDDTFFAFTAHLFQRINFRVSYFLRTWFCFNPKCNEFNQYFHEFYLKHSELLSFIERTKIK